jgi:TetR/AcrR family transcriptional regulator
MSTSAPSRRDAILAAAEREFAAAGFAGARMERIAAAAKVNKQLLFHYFDSKEGLFAAALAALVNRFDADAPPGATPVEQIRSVVGVLLRAVRAAPGVVAILVDAGANPRFPERASVLLRGWRERMLGRLTAAIEDGQRRGYFRDDIEPRVVAGVAAAAALGLGALAAGDRRAEPHGSDAITDAYLTRFVADYCAWR